MSFVEGVPLDCTTQEAWQYHLTRQENDARLSVLNLPTLPDDPTEIYELLRLAEKNLIPDGDYTVGSSTKDNDLLVIRGANGVLVTAEHATKHQRTRNDSTKFPKKSEPGTGALCAVVSEKTLSDALIAIGRQTGDANNDATHPFKDAMTKIIKAPRSRAHLSIHGLRRGLAANPKDERGFSVMLGIGHRPSEATKALADFMIEAGSDYELRVGVNQAFLEFNTDAESPVLNADGTIKTRTFSALGHTTRNHAQTVAEKLGKDDSFAAIQVEFSDVLRCRRNPTDKFPTQRDRELGAYLGYQFLSSSIGRVALI